MASYKDRFITVDDEGIHVSWYYFPVGTKHLAFSAIRQVTERKMGVLTGKWRIWGASSPTQWFSLDPGRTTKTTSFVLDVGRFVHPVLTPDDPDAFRAAIAGRYGAT